MFPRYQPHTSNSGKETPQRGPGPPDRSKTLEDENSEQEPKRETGGFQKKDVE